MAQILWKAAAGAVRRPACPSIGNGRVRPANDTALTAAGKNRETAWKAMPRVPATLACLVLAATVLSCASVDSLSSSLDLTRSTENITTAAKNLKEGLEGFDAVGLKRLLDENLELRDQLFDISRSLTSASSGAPHVVLKDRSLRIELVDSRGAFVLSGWVDDTKNWFWLDRLVPDTNPGDGFDALEIAGRITELSRKNLVHRGFRIFPESPESLDRKLDAQKDEIGAIVADSVRAYVEAAASGSGRSADRLFIDLKPNLLTLGGHVITVRADSLHGAPFTARFRIVSIARDGSEERIKEFDLAGGGMSAGEGGGDSGDGTGSPGGEPAGSGRSGDSKIRGVTREIYLFVDSADK